MKVISIKEPFATLIVKKHKSIETRSWKTSYRGEIYIHASKTMMKDKISENAYKYVPKEQLHSSEIIGKANLVDCIEMTEEYIKTINEKEKLLGIYEVGRYAWVLEDIKEIEPIKAKGKLNIWEYKED